MAFLVEVDRACAETLPQSLRWPWYHFLSQSYNYFRYSFAILEFMDEGNVGIGRHIHQWKTCPQNIGIATAIVSISVSVAKLLILPVWGSFYFRFVPDGVLHSRTVSTQVEVDRAYQKKLCRSRWDHVEMSSHRLVITISSFVDIYFLFAYAVKRSQH